MQYDNPNNIPPAVIRPFNKVAQEDCVNNDYDNLPQPEAPDLGGYPFVNAGTSVTASGTSIYYQVSFVPREGPIPYVELDRAHFAHSYFYITYLILFLRRVIGKPIILR